MKRKILVLIAIMCFLITNTAKAQTNYKSGFYPGVDSVYFTVNWATGVNQVLIWKVNGLSGNAWQQYTQGVWLKKLDENSGNEMFNKVYSREPCNYLFDVSLASGPRNKVNVISVALIDTVTDLVVKDSVYTIGIGAYPHLGYHTSVVTIDSFDYDDMMTRYEEDLEIPGWVCIFDPTGKLQVSQRITFNIAAGSSACIANKGFSIKGDKVMKTSILSNGVIEDLKSIKSRPGGSGQYSWYSFHEIMSTIADTSLITIGGTRSNVGILYVNGIFGTETHFQEKSDNERALAKKWNTHKDSVDVLGSPHFNIYVDTIYSGCKTFTFSLDSFGRKQTLPQLTLKKLNDAFIAFKKGDRTSVQKFASKLKQFNQSSVAQRGQRDTTITICGSYIHMDFHYDSVSTSFYQMLGFDSVQFFPEEFVSLEKTVIVTNPDGQQKMAAFAEEGNNKKPKPVLQRLNEMTFDTTTNHFAELKTLINIDDVLRYIILIYWGNHNDVITNNIMMVLSDKTKMSFVGTDWDDIGIWAGPSASNWNSKIMHDDFMYDEGFLFSVIRMILRHPEAQERMILLQQGMINTILRSGRTTAILDKIKDRVTPWYTYNFNAWGGDPNGGRPSASMVATLDDLRYYIEQRNLPALQITTSYWRPLDSIDVLRDYHQVNVIFDSILPNTAEVIINYDILQHFKSNWSGKFLRKPAITFEVRSLSGFEIKVKEFIDSGSIFKINSDSTVTITLVLRPHILPVELVSFGCSVDSLHNTRLDWSTASEFSNKGFVVERSINATDFDSIGFVAGVGNSNQLRNYFFIDPTTLSGKIYYRIKQVDIDGSYIYSDICIVSLPEVVTNITENIIIYPNPTNGTLFIKNTVLVQKVAVYDVLTRLVYENNTIFDEIPLGTLPRGTYAVVFIMKNGEQITKKITLY